jgi:nucleotide-binding universal stress UspA family protein
MKKILVATDGSEGAGRAIDFAADLAKTTGARLLIVNVLGEQSFPETVSSRFSRTQKSWIHDVLAAESSRILREARERAHAAGAVESQLESRDDDVAQALLEIAEEANADVIVVGKRGSGRVAGLLIGSVSQKLVSLSPRVVIVVP